MNINNKNIGKTLYKYINYFCIASGFFALFFLLYYIIFISKGFYHSDCSDTIMWAQAMIDSKSIMNSDFQYGALLPFGGQLIMAPFVAIFGYGMTAQIIGMVIFAILFTLSVVYFCKAADLNYKWCSLTTTFVLLILCSSEKLREIFWSHIIYYSLGAFFLLLGLGIVFKIIKLEAFSIKHYILLFVWSTLCSINGSQSLTLYTLPVIGALVAERFFDLETPFFSRKNLRQGLIVLNLTVSIVIGLVLAKIINQGITSNYQNAFSDFDKVTNWTQNILSLFPAVLSLCGVDPSEITTMFSPLGIFLLLRIIGIIIVITTPFIMLLMYKKFDNKTYKITILTHVFLTILLLMGWIFGKLNYANWRLSPLLVTASILTIMFIRWIIKQKKYARLSAMLAIPVSILFVIFTMDLFTTCLEKQNSDNKKLEAIGEYLIEEGLEYGYSNFWYANSIPLLSDSKVKISSIDIINNNIYPTMYQSNINWYKNNNYSEYFLMLSRDEYSSYTTSENYKEPKETKYFIDQVILIYDYNIMNSK